MIWLRCSNDSWYGQGKSGEAFLNSWQWTTKKHNLCFKIIWNVNSNIRLKFFTRRVINYWNHLTDEIVSCKSLSTFKIKLMNLWLQKGKFKFIVVRLMHDSFPLLALFLYSVLGSGLRLSRWNWVRFKDIFGVHFYLESWFRWHDLSGQALN